jgi:two-component system sensor histidine kinase KdpD
MTTPSERLQWLGALGAVTAVTLILGPWLHIHNAAIASITYLLVVLVVAAASRLLIAVVTSVVAMLALNFFFLPPIGTFTIADPQNWAALFAFLTLAGFMTAALQREHLLEARRAGEVARQSEQLKTALLASLGHDLRTPLTAIRVAASNLKTTGFSPEERLEQSDLILAEVERLTRLFQNLLEMARIDAGAIAEEARWVHPSEIVAAARDQVEHTLGAHTVEVAIDPDLPVRLDPRLTAAALAHLLENAAQYSPPGSAVRVDAHSGAAELIIRVRDRGPGVAPADLPHLFDRFYRGTASRTRKSGTGMGLWIVRGLLSVERGRVWAENCADGGAQFTIAVPAQVSPAQGAEASAT